MIYREKDLGPTLCHFNPNHDPRNGQFTATKWQNADGSLTKKGNKKLRKTWHEAYNNASNKQNEVLDQVNKKYKGADLHWEGDTMPSEDGQKYIRELDASWKKLYVSELRSKYPELIINGERWMKDAPFMNMYEELLIRKND
jgi:hypothetical protein